MKYAFGDFVAQNSSDMKGLGRFVIENKDYGKLRYPSLDKVRDTGITTAMYGITEDLISATSIPPIPASSITSPTFFEKNKTIILTGLALLGAYFIYTKMIKKEVRVKRNPRFGYDGGTHEDNDYEVEENPFFSTAFEYIPKKWYPATVKELDSDGMGVKVKIEASSENIFSEVNSKSLQGVKEGDKVLVTVHTGDYGKSIELFKTV